MDCDLAKVQAMDFRLDLGRMTTFLDQAVKNDAQAKAMLDAIGRPVLEVRYEALIGDQAAAKHWWGTILQFIGISRECAPVCCCSCSCCYCYCCCCCCCCCCAAQALICALAYSTAGFARAGADVHFLESDWRRQIVKGHAETISNYADVKAKLAEHRGGMHLQYL